MTHARWWQLALITAAMAAISTQEADAGLLFGHRGGCGGQRVEVGCPATQTPVCAPYGSVIVMVNAVEPVATPAHVSPILAMSLTSARSPGLSMQLFEWKGSRSVGPLSSRSGSVFLFDSIPTNAPDLSASGYLGGFGGGGSGGGGGGGGGGSGTGSSVVSEASTLGFTSSMHLDDFSSRNLMILGIDGYGARPSLLDPSAADSAGISRANSGSRSTYVPGAATGQIAGSGPIASGSGTAVPEPSAIVSTLVGLAIATGAWTGRRNRLNKSTTPQEVA